MMYVYATKQFEHTVLEMLSSIQFLLEMLEDGVGSYTGLFLIYCFIVLWSSN
jgi:hypothetical protein